MSALSDKSYAHIRSIISQDLTATGDTKKYSPTEIHHFLEGEQTLIDADKPSPGDVVLATMTAKTTKYAKLTCEGCKSRGRQNFTGHMLPWCILEGGSMARKTIVESRMARLAHLKARDKNHKKGSSKIMVMPSGGSMFTLEGDPELIAAYMATREGKPATAPTGKTEFAGLASDILPTLSSISEVEDLEFDAFIVEEEAKTGVDWTHHTNHEQANETALTATSHEALSFYLDSGATVHITPNQSDFLSLSPIPECSICGVGGSSIAATRIGKICLHVQGGAVLELDDALLVPKSTVRLLSISKLAKHAGIETAFNNTGAILTKTPMRTVIATGNLLPNKNLYALNLQCEHALTMHDAPDIQTWHN